MTNPLDHLFLVHNERYVQKAKPKTKWKKLKNITPTKEESEKSLAYLDKKIKQLEEIL